MIRIPKFIGLHAVPGRTLSIVLGALPFIVLIVGYIIISHMRLIDNPDDKITPSLLTIASDFYDYAFVPDFRGNYLLLQDVEFSLYRLSVGIAAAALVGLLLGIHMSLFAGVRALFEPIVTCVSNIPPLSLSPIILLTVGTGDEVKMLIVFIGIVLTISRDIFEATNEIPNEQITKSLTLGAYEWEVVYKITLPQIVPALVNAVRLNLITAWVYLIAAEAMSSSVGLGYRISIVKRTLSMGQVITCVLIVALLAYLMDYGLRQLNKRCYPWYVALRGNK